MIVVDASALVELLTDSKQGETIAGDVWKARSLHAPELVDLEVAQTLRQLVAAKVIDADDAEYAVRRLGDLDMRRYPHRPLFDRIWILRHNLTPYDAAYVALAERLDATLVTCDRKIARASGHFAETRVF